MDFSKFEKSVGVVFKDKSLLAQAFTHRSYLNENPAFAAAGNGHNERLEFLGDAVLELVVTENLYAKYPEKPEGELTSYRAALVNTISIGTLAADLGMNEYLLLSKGEAKDTGRARQTILANAFESLLGALYLDAGYDSVKAFIEQHLLSRTEETVAKKLWMDAKSYFQEKAQAQFGTTPHYEILESSGPDHDRKFVAGVFVGKELMAKGIGASKQDAEQEAAREGLRSRGWDR